MVAKNEEMIYHLWRGNCVINGYFHVFIHFTLYTTLQNRLLLEPSGYIGNFLSLIQEQTLFRNPVQLLKKELMFKKCFM